VPLSRFVPRGFGFVHHSIAILYDEVPYPNLTIRNFCIAVHQLSRRVLVQGRRGGGTRAKARAAGMRAVRRNWGNERKRDSLKLKSSKPAESQLKGKGVWQADRSLCLLSHPSGLFGWIRRSLIYIHKRVQKERKC
jgi:hypothetical protein